MGKQTNVLMKARKANKCLRLPLHPDKPQSGRNGVGKGSRRGENCSARVQNSERRRRIRHGRAAQATRAEKVAETRRMGDTAHDLPRHPRSSTLSSTGRSRRTRHDPCPITAAVRARRMNAIPHPHAHSQTLRCPRTELYRWTKISKARSP